MRPHRPESTALFGAKDGGAAEMRKSGSQCARIIYPLQGLPSPRGGVAGTAHVCHPTSTLKEKPIKGASVLCIPDSYSVQEWSEARRSHFNTRGREKAAGEERRGEEQGTRRLERKEGASGSLNRLLNSFLKHSLSPECLLISNLQNHRGGKAQWGRMM